jgi:hypothetical protein
MTWFNSGRFFAIYLQHSLTVLMLALCSLVGGFLCSLSVLRAKYYIKSAQARFTIIYFHVQ